MLSFFTKKRTGGLIAYYGLADWWLLTFTEDEHRHIIATFQPLGSAGDTLTSGEITFSSQSAVALLSNLAGWFYREPDRSVARRILAKAEELATSDTPILDRHFHYQAIIELYYRDREEPQFLEKAIEACRQQIALAPAAAQAFKTEYADSPLPAHRGYQQLAIILEKQDRFPEVIDLCTRAAQQGWSGDWAARINRCAKKMEKITSCVPTSPRPFSS